MLVSLLSIIDQIFLHRHSLAQLIEFYPIRLLKLSNKTTEGFRLGRQLASTLQNPTSKWKINIKPTGTKNINYI
jgi:hypothetical protein